MALHRDPHRRPRANLRLNAAQRHASRPEGTSMPTSDVRSADPPEYAFHPDLGALVGDVPEGSIVSRTLHQDELVKVTLFGFAAGQELTEHTSSKPAILQVIAGEGSLGFGDDVRPVAPGSWAHMAPGVPHTVIATTRLVLLLTLLKHAG
jgi:quercetin dioxygenase-like cupin family protein